MNFRRRGLHLGELLTSNSLLLQTKKIPQWFRRLHCSVEFSRLSVYLCQLGMTGLGDWLLTSHITVVKVSTKVNCCFVHFGESNMNVAACVRVSVCVCVCVCVDRIYIEIEYMYVCIISVIEIECMCMYIHAYAQFLWQPWSN